ncbi:MAG: hypothetical protein AB7F99_07835 [Vicinamibacterales bacterium]
MPRIIAGGIVVGLIVVAIALWFAMTPRQQSTPLASLSHGVQADHVMTGVVKSITGTTLVINQSPNNQGDMTFRLNASTHRAGTINVGAPVSIRYRDNGGTHVATAVTARPA